MYRIAAFSVHLGATLVLMVPFVTASSPYYRQPQETTRTLYKSSDHLLQLGGADFLSTISATDNAWIIEFYATWCGHCQRFAPVWKSFANDIKGWAPIIRVAAVACSDPSNAEICRKNNVRGYPTVKFYPPHAGPTFLGDPYYGVKTTGGLRTGTLNYIDRLRREGRTTASWPILRVLRSPVEAQESLSRQTHHIYLIIEGAGQTTMELNKMVILDLAEKYPEVAVMRVTRNDVGSGAGHTLYRLQQDGQTTPLSRSTSREALRANILADFNAQQPGAQISTVAPTAAPSTQPAVYKFVPSDGLHMQDLESSLYYSLWVEVGGQHDIISGKALRALKTYISVLARYHPGEAHIIRFLNHTNWWLHRQSKELPGAQWVRDITRLQTDAAYVPDRLRWTGCRGSQPRFRGYPCSLWMTFHALTVAAFTRERDDDDFDPLEVLKAIRGYVRHFLGCTDCAAHFGNMSANMVHEVTHRRKDGVLWLWQAHNKVNNRLHGDTTEDPQNLKIQFPSPKACSTCRRRSPSGRFDNETQWNESEVFRYLLGFYRQKFVIDDDLPYEFEEATTSPPTTTTIATTTTTRPTTTTTKTTTTTRQTTTENAKIILGSTTFPTSIPSSIRASNAPNTGANQTSALRHVSSCVPMATDWSLCSRSCDAGYSSRMSNANPRCRLELETRVCNLRPCGVSFNMWDDPGQQYLCPYYGSTYRDSRPRPLMLNDCRTRKAYKWRYCGMCPGMCCYPSQSDTLWLELECWGGNPRNVTVGYSKIEWVRRCRCADRCPGDTG